jgi:hypothetical protein
LIRRGLLTGQYHENRFLIEQEKAMFALEAPSAAKLGFNTPARMNGRKRR